MHEAVLRDFFLGKVLGRELKQDLIGSVIKTGAEATRVDIYDMDNEFEVLPEHLVRICDAVISGELEPPDLSTVGFCVLASDNFIFDVDSETGDRVAETLNDWVSHRINYRLTTETARKFKERLLTGKSLFTNEDINWEQEM